MCVVRCSMNPNKRNCFLLIYSFVVGKMSKTRVDKQQANYPKVQRELVPNKTKNIPSHCVRYPFPYICTATTNWTNGIRQEKILYLRIVFLCFHSLSRRSPLLTLAVVGDCATLLVLKFIFLPCGWLSKALSFKRLLFKRHNWKTVLSPSVSKLLSYEADSLWPVFESFCRWA